MRIAFCIPRKSFTEQGMSGDKTYVRALIKGLAERGHELRVVAPVNIRDFWRGRIPVRRFFAEAIAVRREMKQFLPDAWLVYDVSVTNPDLFGWWQSPKRYVLMHALMGQGSRLSHGWRWLFTFVHRRSLARADKLSAYHPAAFDSLRYAGIEEQRLSFLTPGIKIPELFASRDEGRSRLGLDKVSPMILSITRLSESKTEIVENSLAALVTLPSDVIFVHVGDGPGRWRVEEKLAKLNLDKRVKLVGAVPHEQVQWFYVACDIFAFPSAIDRPSLAILEAQACGCPVVAIRNRSTELTVDDGRTGLLAKDMDEFQVHLALLVSDPVLRERLGNAGPEYIAKHHSIERRVEQIEEMLLGGCQG